MTNPTKPPYRVTVFTVREVKPRTYRTSTERHTFDTLEDRDAFISAPTGNRVTAFGIDYETLRGKVYRTDYTRRPAL